MAVNELNLCMGCMSPLSDDGKCEVCGYEGDASSDANYLPAKTLLAERYVVGKLLGSDPEGAWYAGYDLTGDIRVWVREYMPPAIAERSTEDKKSLLPKSGSEAQYKATLSDFEDLSAAIKALPEGEKVVPVTEILRENNTAYAIYRYIKTISLESFLTRSGGKLSWRHTKKLLMPLYHTVANVHKIGLIHRGLSPQTIQLDQSGALWINDLFVAAARTDKSELTAQLYGGYAAPEQYLPDGWQGPWTDVYALAALTFHVFTGKHLPKSCDRDADSVLLDSSEVGSEITESTVNAINKALTLDAEKRTQTAEQFVAELLATEGSNTAVYSTAPKTVELRDEVVASEISFKPDAAEKPLKRNSAPAGVQSAGGGFKFRPAAGGAAVAVAPSKPAKKRKLTEQEQFERIKTGKSHPVLTMILLALLATAMLAFIVYGIANIYLSDLMAPNGATNFIPQIMGIDYSDVKNLDESKVPKFVGVNVDSIKTNDKLQSNFVFFYKEQFNDTHDVGVVYDQVPLEGSELPEDGRITLYVSKGSEIASMPDLVGMSVADAQKLLDGLKIKYHVTPVYERSGSFNTVLRTDPAEVGTPIAIATDTVYLYVRHVGEPRIVGSNSGGSGGKASSSGGKITGSSDAKSDEQTEAPAKSSSAKSSKSSSSRKQQSSSTGRKLKPANANGWYDENGEWVQIIDSESESQAAPKVESKAPTQPESEAAQKPESKAASKAQSKSESKSVKEESIGGND